MLLARITLALTASLLLILSFPDYNQHWLAWIAFVPLIVACHGQSPLMAFSLGVISGIAAQFGIFAWIFEVPGFRFYHFLLLGTYMGLYTAVWSATFTLFREQQRLAIIPGAAAWVILDYLMANAGFLAFSWATLAYSQYRNLPIIQIASVTGEYGITFVVMLVNIAIADLITGRRWKQATVTVLVVSLLYLWGSYALLQDDTDPSVRVAAVQPSIIRSETRTLAGLTEPLNRLEELTLRAASEKPSLIVWPETSIRALSEHPELVYRVYDIAQSAGTPLIVGSVEHGKLFRRENKQEDAENTARRTYNSAYFIKPDSPLLPPYHKNRLVPFAEYIPLDSVIDWPGWLVPDINPITPGEKYRHYRLSSGAWVTPLICWENLFPDYVRRAMVDGSNIIVHLVNDNWFGYSAAARQHNMASVIRAVENRVPVVVASNTGPSEVIDSHGRIKARLQEIFTTGVAMAEIVPGSGKTFYSRFGDVFVLMCTLAVVIAAIKGMRATNRRNAGGAI